MRSATHIALWIAASVPALAFGQSDLCPGATLVACGAVVTGNTTAATADVAPFCGTTDGTAGGVWYRFTGTGGTINASLCGSTFDTKIRVYTGTCGALACTVGNDDFCGLQSQVSWPSTLGVTYYILVHGFGAAAGNYTLSITCPPPPTPMCYAQTITPYVADPYAGTAVVLTDDIHSAAVNIGFSFCFNSVSYTQCVISSNNYITFNLANAGTFSPWTTVAVPNATPTPPQNAVLDPWQDIDPGVGGAIYYQTLGAAPNRRFVVSYASVPMFSCTGQLYSSQIILYESSNCIRSSILSKPICPTWNSGNAVHGLQNNGGTSATVVPGRNNTAWTAAAEGRLWAPTCAPCSTLATGACLALVLPVELLYVRGQHTDGANVVEWATASEERVDHFTVERSSDGLSFTPVHHTPAVGQQSGSTYIVRDEQPLSGVNFYRVRSTDTDGAIDLSEMIAVHAPGPSTIFLYPNPNGGKAQLQLPPDMSLPAEAIIRDLAGRELLRTVLTQRDAPIELGMLGDGSYVLTFGSFEARTSTRFTISR
jgi:hypothetical protein